MTELPLFPLRSVLCPGVALPLHVFEERYRLMVDRCLERDEPFGVVLLREGREVGPLRGQVAAVGTTAAIRRAGTYPDGSLDILTVGQQRFRLEDIDNVSEPYLVGRVNLLEEPTGPEGIVREQAERVGQRFIEYLELLQPADDSEGPEIEIEFEIEVDDDEAEVAGAAPGVPEREERASSDAVEHTVESFDAEDLSADDRRELLMSAAHRLTATDDPTALSYVLIALLQVDLGARQGLLEVPDTATRLSRIEGLLSRESWFLQQGLRPVIVDPHGSGSPLG